MASREAKNGFGFSLGQALETYRMTQNMKQKDLAEQLHVDERTLRRWEKGLIPQNIDELKRIADILGIDYEQLGLASSLYTPRTPEQIDEAIELGWSYVQQLRYIEGRAFIEKLLRDLTLQVTKEDVAYLQRLARVQHLAGYITSESSRTENVPDAFQHYHEMEQIARILNDDILLNIALTYEGDMLRRQGKILEAVPYLEAARDATTDVEAKGNALQLLGRVHLGQKSVRDFENVMAEATELGFAPQTGTTKALFNLGAVYEEYGKSYGWVLGQTQKGLDYLDLAEKNLPSTAHWALVLKTARAMALVRSGDVTTGGQLAVEATLQCYQTGNYRMLERVYTIENFLEQKANEYGQLTKSLQSVLKGPIGQI